MSTALTRGTSNQPYPDPFWPDFIEANLRIIGSDTPHNVERYQMAHGRHLAGLGNIGADGGVQASDEPDWSDRATRELEGDDDVVGSGIFDEAGSPATVNRRLGVFADDPSIPGFIARNPPFTVNHEVKDVNGAQVVEVPAGGMSYVEVDGRLAPPALWPKPPSQATQYGPVPWRPSSHQVGLSPQAHRLGMQSIVNPTPGSIPVNGDHMYGGRMPAPLAPIPPPPMPMFAPRAPMPQPVQGYGAFGDDGSGNVSLAAVAIGGLLVGALFAYLT